MDGFTTAATALAVILSAIVRLVRTDAALKAVDEGYATSDHLRELSGVLDPRALQDVFGPPTLEGVYHVDRRQIMDSRRLTGWLIGDMRLDLACLAIAVLILVLPRYGVLHDLAVMPFLLAVAYQIGGWICAGMLMGRGRR